MRSPEVQEEEQALRDLSVRIAALQAELNATRQQYIDRCHALRALNAPVRALTPSGPAEYAINKTLPGKSCSAARDAHNTSIFFQDTVRHVARGWYGYVADNRLLPDGTTRTLVYLQRTRDGHPYRKAIAKLVPTSELEHVYHVPFRGLPA